MKLMPKLIGAAGSALIGAALNASVFADDSRFVTIGDTDRFSAIFFGIQDAEYEINWQAGVDAFQSPNRAQHLRFTYFDTGFRAERRRVQDLADLWSVELRVESLGKPEAWRALGVAELLVDRKSASATHDGIKIEYVNGEDGMRQSFLVDQPLRPGELRLNIAVLLEGVGMGISADGDYVFFVNTAEEVMRYGDLNVWDATGKVLPAQFELVDDEHFSIVVDDSGATYPILVDPLSFYWSAFGDQGYAQFGFSVAYGNFKSIYGDIVVGAPYYDDGQEDEGKVFVYYGTSSGHPTTPDWTAQSNYTGAVFGYSLAAGKLDGEDRDDLIVGAQNYASGSLGGVFVWFGGSTGLGANGTPSNADWQKTGSSSTSGFGMSVAAGDFDGDGYADLVVGAPWQSGGKVYVFNGSESGPSSSANWTATASGDFGRSVAWAGDVNGDGYGDIIIGAPGYTNGQTGEGAAFIWHGSSSGLTPNPGTGSNMARRLEKNQPSAQFGYAVASGNVNGDEYSDVIVGAPTFDNPESNEGMVFVYQGSSSGIPSTESWSAQSDQASAQFGFSVACLDLTFLNDGYADVIVGAPYYDYVNANCGMVLVWYGDSTGLGDNGTPSNADWAAANVRGGSNSGYSVAAGKNVRIYHPGVIIGSPRDTLGSPTPKGAVDVFTQE